jgi:hypothetical protein
MAGDTANVERSVCSKHRQAGRAGGVAWGAHEQRAMSTWRCALMTTLSVHVTIMSNPSGSHGCENVTRSPAVAIAAALRLRRRGSSQLAGWLSGVLVSGAARLTWGAAGGVAPDVRALLLGAQVLGMGPDAQLCAKQ